MIKRKKIRVRGIVQGVGFRPFVYRLATNLELRGFVRNTTDGVDIEIEGRVSSITQFINRLKNESPTAANVAKIDFKELPINGDKRFIIKESKRVRGFTQIAPDIATCKECLVEFNNPSDRRYKFPFINCINCGPRYSIILKPPYDRRRTSMRDFKMCLECKREFNCITARRFHAQPDCCPICGPRFSLYLINGKRIKSADPITQTAEFLKSGEIVAIKGIGGFHIACDATSSRVVNQLRRLKNRPAKPFAIMTQKRDLKNIVYISDEEEKIMSSPIAPVMLLEKRGGIIAPEVAPNNSYLGVMLPYAPVHYLLLAKIPYLVMTSANIQDEPVVKDDEEVRQNLEDIVSFYLTHNREIENRCDDSVGFYIPGKNFSIIRRSRGYVPVPIDLPFPVKPTIAVGPHLKNTFALANKWEAYISPHIGILDNLKTLKFFHEMLEKYRHWFKIKPELIVHDLHPDYLSTKIAQRLEGKKVGVQHHIAHIASCLGENRITTNVIGIAFDGTGYGTDGKIWGGEFFFGNLKSMKRVAHLEYLPLPGGEACIKSPYRIAIAYLYKIFGDVVAPAYRPGRVRAEEINAISQMIERDRNLVYTSSMGRLFDCVAAMLGIKGEITYDAEAAISLEYIAASGIREYYPYKLVVGAGLSRPNIIIKVGDILGGIIKDIKKNRSNGIISAKFHNTVAQFSLDISKKLSKIYKMKKVCFSGGVFQNRYLLNLMIKKFELAGFKVYLHHKVPTNDGGISYGQVIAGNSIRS